MPHHRHQARLFLYPLTNLSVFLTATILLNIVVHGFPFNEIVWCLSILTLPPV